MVPSRTLLVLLLSIDIWTNWARARTPFPKRNRQGSHRGPRFLDLGEWLIDLSANHLDEAIVLAICYARIVKVSSESIYDYEDRYPSLLTSLFREAEEREISDNGDMMRKVLELQDLLVSVGIPSIEGWLRSAERR